MKILLSLLLAAPLVWATAPASAIEGDEIPAVSILKGRNEALALIVFKSPNPVNPDSCAIKFGFVDKHGNDTEGVREVILETDHVEKVRVRSGDVDGQNNGLTVLVRPFIAEFATRVGACKEVIAALVWYSTKTGRTEAVVALPPINPAACDFNICTD